MSVKVQCQACGSSFAAGEESRGRSIPCARCQRPVQVPAPDAIVDDVPGATAKGRPNSDIFGADADSIFVNPEKVSEDVFGRNEVFDPGRLDITVRPQDKNAPTPNGSEPARGAGFHTSETMMLPADAPPALSRDSAPALLQPPPRLEVSPPPPPLEASPPPLPLDAGPSPPPVAAA